jgi:chromate transport protein ChrA
MEALMTKNMGTADRTIRTLVAIVIAVLYFTGYISGVLAIILCVIAVLFLVTSFLGWCPAYLPIGLSTRKRPKSSSDA